MQRRDMVRALRPSVYRRLALSLAASALFLALLAQRLQAVEPTLVLQALARVGPVPWIGAILATWVSFRAVAGYDVALHRHLGTGFASGRAGRAGFAAIAIGQTVGLGVVSGTLVRWRMLPELGFQVALRLSLLVALSFLAAWGVLTLAVLAVVSGGALAGYAAAGLAAIGIGIGLGLLMRPVGLPNLITQSRLLSIAAVDCLAAGLALWLLIPGEVAPLAFLPAFLLALGAGLVSGAPAGLGAFEIVLIGLLPGVDEPRLLAGLLAWRVIYYAAPAVAGAGVALVASRGEPRPVRASLPPPAIAEAGLTALGEFRVEPCGSVAASTAHGLVALSEVASLPRFRQAAREQGRWPVIYKAGPRAAARARASGMVALPVALEAWLCPKEFRLDLPARAGLRRKLRRAEAAGVTAQGDPRPDMALLARVNADWVAARGAEHGFSMGRFDPQYLAGQRVMLARLGGAVVGFASFHEARITGRTVWTLDLLRPGPAAPDGTAHSLVHAALLLARDLGVARVSLAAVPLGSVAAERGLIARLGRRVAPGAMAGLVQFKAGFAPNWQRLYLVGPSVAALALVGWEIWTRVRHPVPLAKSSRTTAHDAEYEIASGCNPWQRGEDRLT